MSPKWTPKSTAGAGPNPAVAAGGAAKVVGTPCDFPDLIELDGTAARPSILAIGGSGTGKTFGAAQMLAAGKNAIVVAVEPKIQILSAYKPRVLFLGAPIQEKATGALRPPTHSEIFNRLWQFTDRLGRGEFRENNGKPVDLLIIDGLMEVGSVIHRHFKEHTPISKGTGERNTFLMADEIGTHTLDFARACRDAASSAAQLYGVAPVGMYCTVGEEEKESKIPGMPSSYRPMLYGNIAPKNLPYQFEAIVRLSVATTEAGTTYIATTASDEGQGLIAKVPGGLFPPTVPNWNMNTIYDSIVNAYETGAVNVDTPVATT